MIPIAPLVAMLSMPPRAVRLPGPSAPVNGPTYAKEVVRLFQAHCQTCHHPGDVAPFALTNYQEAKANAAKIKLKTQAREMPPWKPTAGCGNFADANVRTLTDGEIDLLARWVDSGAPFGDSADLPQPLDFGGGWQLGTPSQTLSNPEPFTPPADRDEYRCFTLPTNQTADQYVSAIDVRPGNRGEVHHVIAFLDTTGESQKLDDDSPGAGYTCFGGPGFNVTGSLARIIHANRKNEIAGPSPSR